MEPKSLLPLYENETAIEKKNRQRNQELLDAQPNPNDNLCTKISKWMVRNPRSTRGAGAMIAVTMGVGLIDRYLMPSSGMPSLSVTDGYGNELHTNNHYHVDAVTIPDDTHHSEPSQRRLSSAADGSKPNDAPTSPAQADLAEQQSAPAPPLTPVTVTRKGPPPDSPRSTFSPPPTPPRPRRPVPKKTPSSQWIVGRPKQAADAPTAKA